MDERTLTALKGSIEKWQKIVDGTGFDDGIENCPLCAEFHPRLRAEPSWAPCGGCPVFENTQSVMCGGTPYDVWEDGVSDLDVEDAGYVHTDSSLAAATAELEFLKSLLPEEATSLISDLTGGATPRLRSRASRQCPLTPDNPVPVSAQPPGAVSSPDSLSEAKR